MWFYYCLLKGYSFCAGTSSKDNSSAEVIVTPSMCACFYVLAVSAVKAMYTSALYATNSHSLVVNINVH